MKYHDEIAKVAYELYEKSGYCQGKDHENWSQAEKIVMARHAHQETAKPVEETGKKRPVAVANETAATSEKTRPAKKSAAVTEGAATVKKVTAKKAVSKDIKKPAKKSTK